MTLRGRAVAYLVAIHLIFAALAVYLFLDNRFWLLGVEAVFAVSLVVGLRLSREMYRQFGLAAEGLRLIRDEEFTSRFLPVGQPEIDELIGVYNRMVDHLRDERVRLAEQHQFLSQVLHVSPSGVVILDFDRRVSQRSTPPPSGCSTGPARRWSAVAWTLWTRRSAMRSPRSGPARRAWSGCSARGA